MMLFLNVVLLGASAMVRTEVDEVGAAGEAVFEQAVRREGHGAPVWPNGAECAAGEYCNGEVIGMRCGGVPGICTPCSTNPDGTLDELPRGAAPCGACALNGEHAGRLDCTACDQGLWTAAGPPEFVDLIAEGNAGPDQLRPGADLGRKRCWARPLTRVGKKGLPALCDDAPTSAKDEVHPIGPLSLGQLWGVWQPEACVATKLDVYNDCAQVPVDQLKDCSVDKCTACSDKREYCKYRPGVYEDMPVRVTEWPQPTAHTSGQRAGRYGHGGVVFSGETKDEMAFSEAGAGRLVVSFFPLNGMRGEKAAQVGGSGILADQYQFEIAAGTALFGSPWQYQEPFADENNARLERSSGGASMSMNGGVLDALDDVALDELKEFEEDLNATFGDSWSLNAAPVHGPRLKTQVRILAGKHRGQTGEVVRAPLCAPADSSCDGWQVMLEGAEAVNGNRSFGSPSTWFGSPPSPALATVKAADLGPVLDTLFTVERVRLTDTRSARSSRLASPKAYEAEVKWTDGTFFLTMDEAAAGPRLRLSKPALRDLATCLDSVQARAAVAAGVSTDRDNFAEAVAVLRKVAGAALRDDNARA